MNKLEGILIKQMEFLDNKVNYVTPIKATYLQACKMISKNSEMKFTKVDVPFLNGNKFVIVCDEDFADKDYTPTIVFVQDNIVKYTVDGPVAIFGLNEDNTLRSLTEDEYFQISYMTCAPFPKEAGVANVFRFNF